MFNSVGLSFAFIALIFGLPARAAEPTITPRPTQVIERTGLGFRINDGTPLLVPAGDPDVGNVAQYLADLARRTGGPLLVPTTNVSKAPAINFVRRPGFAAEGYAIDVSPRAIVITASQRAGLLYGAVSLWQLMTVATHGELAPVHIADAPRFPWRGLMLDSARHFQSAAEIGRTLDWMALHKLNRLQWHLADDQGWRLEIKRYPRLTSVGAWRNTPPAAGMADGRYGGFYSQEEVRRLVARATALNSTIVPEKEMPGHATAAILAYPAVGLTTATAANLGDWGVFPSIYGVDASSLAFLDGVLDEVMTLFPSREIAIGGDEAVHDLWHNSPLIQAKMRSLGLKNEVALQGWFIGKIGTYLNTHGRRLVGWDEILADKALSKNDIVMSWHGADGAIAAPRAGHDVVMATAPTLYLDNRQSTLSGGLPGRGQVVSLADIYAYDPGDPPHLPGTGRLDAAASKNILGVQGALWSEHIDTDARLEAMALPRAAALAEIGWTARQRIDWASFVSRLPAMMARYSTLGLQADDSAFAVQAQIVPTDRHARMALTQAIPLGNIHYTTDGSAPSLVSLRYKTPLDLPLPARLRATSFVGSQQLSPNLDTSLDAVSVTRRTSLQLELCSNGVSLNLMSGTKARQTTYLVDIKNPCWIYRGAALGGVRHIGLSVAALPFNYQFADEASSKPLTSSASMTGELVLRRGCDGPVLATVKLQPVLEVGAARDYTVAIPRQTRSADMCFSIVRAKNDPLYALGWVELRP
ncbi:family 20 glycosylhydrolase [Sphingomonas sp.]|uniref:beta-N-acetylhexosaminidase n=1 Tax=Sphingomonas sp. TaxID=28214 RepID=UPI0025D534ED|nr:family 20 glycosylhydrolase [Sphingomonas sp.]